MAGGGGSGGSKSNGQPTVESTGSSLLDGLDRSLYNTKISNVINNTVNTILIRFNPNDLLMGSQNANQFIGDWLDENTYNDFGKIGGGTNVQLMYYLNISGFSGDDVLIGSDFNDELCGSDDDDYILGGKGYDSLIGGSYGTNNSEGRDTFIYTTKNDGIDAIKDFEVGTGVNADVLHLSDLLDEYQYNNINDIIKFVEVDLKSRTFAISKDGILDTIVEIGKDIDPNNYVTIWLMEQSGLDLNTMIADGNIVL